MRLPRSPAVSALLALVLAACGDVPTDPQPARLTIVSGSGQTAPAGGTLPEPIRVQVSDFAGRALEGVTVNWETGDGSFASASSTSDENGITSNTWTLGPDVGTQLGRAVLENGAADFVFKATATGESSSR